MELGATSVILLAAGNSSRLGSPKQLLLVNNTTLLENSLAAAIAVAPSNTFLVLGAALPALLPVLTASPVKRIINSNWEEGIASSIRAGLTAVLEQRAAEQVIIMVCDQPFLQATHLYNLIVAAETSTKGIIASIYKQVAGTPVLFKQKYFADLLNLQGDNGARKLLVKFAGDIVCLPFKNGEIDIDTAQDYEKLKEHDPG